MVDQKQQICYNNGMKSKVNEILQWTGAAFIVVGHGLNAVGPSAYPYNILTFLIGTILFLVWGIRVVNKPQIFVNVVSVIIGVTGMINAVS